LIGGGLARLSGNAVLSRTTPRAGVFWRRHQLVGLLLAGASVLLVALAGPAQASPGQQDTASSAGASDDRRGETSQTSDVSPSRDSASDDSGSASDDQDSDTCESSVHEFPGDTAPVGQNSPDARSATGTDPPVTTSENSAPPADDPPAAVPPRGVPSTSPPTTSDEDSASPVVDAPPNTEPPAAPPTASVVFSTCPGCARPPPGSGCSTALTASRTTGAGGWAQSKPEERRGATWSTREPTTALSRVRRLTPPVALTPPASSALTPGTSANGSGSGTGYGEHLDDLATLASSGAVGLVQASARIASGATGRVVRGGDDPRGHPD
jgi:hypothetical protein